MKPVGNEVCEGTYSFAGFEPECTKGTSYDEHTLVTVIVSACFGRIIGWVYIDHERWVYTLGVPWGIVVARYSSPRLYQMIALRVVRGVSSR